MARARAGARVNGDGRLDLDELGRPVDAAGTEAVDLLEGEQEPTTGLGRWVRGPLALWLGQHRAALAAVSVLLLSAAPAWALWSFQQPPPWRPIDVQVEQVSEGSVTSPGVRAVDEAVAAAAYVATAGGDGWLVTIDGLEGPGVRASSAVSQDEPSRRTQATVRAVLGCPSDLEEPDPADYSLRVSITDPWGRSRLALAPLPPAVIDWGTTVRHRCWTQATASGVRILGLRGEPDLVGGSVTVTVASQSRLPVASVAYVDSGTWGSSLVPVAPAFTRMTPDAVTTVVNRIVVTDCSAGAPALPQLPDPGVGRRADTRDGIGFAVLSSDLRVASVIPVPFTPAQRAEVSGALAAVCKDTPRAALRSVAVLSASADPGQSTHTMRLRVDVDIPVGRTAIVGVDQDGGLGYPYPAGDAWVDVPRGGGTVDVSWTFTCQDAEPPSADLRFTESVSPTPLKLAIDHAALLPELRAACPAVSDSELADAGWEIGPRTDSAGGA
jgi:hypothetical protein